MLSGFSKKLSDPKLSRGGSLCRVAAGASSSLRRFSSVGAALLGPAAGDLSAIGFPISLILRGPGGDTEGIRATPAAPAARAGDETDRTRRDRRHRFRRSRNLSAARASARKLDKSIAVLPFENFSDDKETLFRDGIQDDILPNFPRSATLR